MGILASVLTTPPPPVVAPLIETAASGYQGEILAVTVVGLGIGVVILSLKRGWGMFKGFAR